MTREQYRAANRAQRVARRRINVKHLFHGEINSSGKAVGFHHRGSIGYEGRARIVPGTQSAPNSFGVYRGKVQVFNRSTGTWVNKNAQSSFFPDSWSRGRVISEIRGAFANRVGTSGKPANYWEGISPSGARIGGYLDGAGNINTAFPLY